MTSTYWIGGNSSGCGNSNNFYNVKNWSTGQSPANFHDVNITGTSASQPAIANAFTASNVVVPSLTVGAYGTLNITAQSCQSSQANPVFSTQSFQIFQNGTVTVNTSSAVQLGSINNITGTLNIQNNQSNVFFDPSNRLTGTGNLNLTNATLGSQSTAINIDDAMHVNLAGASSVYTGFLATGATVNFDQNSQETFFLTGSDTTVGTAFTNVSQNSTFAVTANTGATPVSAAWQQNSNNTYSLVVQESGNHTLTLNNVSFASGYTPGQLTITQDNAGDYLISTASSNNGGGNAGGGCGGWNGWGGGWGGCGNGGWGGWGCGNGGWGGWGGNSGWSNSGWGCGTGGNSGWAGWGGSSCGQIVQGLQSGLNNLLQGLGGALQNAWNLGNCLPTTNAGCGGFGGFAGFGLGNVQLPGCLGVPAHNYGCC